MTTPEARIDVYGVMLLVLLAAISPAFMLDDAALFNYMNNVTEPRPLFYYLDYVGVVPDVTGYLLRGLPLALQAILYRVLPMAVTLLLCRELQKLLRLTVAGAEASLLALAAMLMLRAADMNIWANLTFLTWPSFLTALVHVLRINASKARYSPWALAGIVVSMASIPFGLLLAVVMIANLRRDADPIRNRQNIVAALAGLIGYGILNARVLSISIGVEPFAVLSLLREGFRNEHRLPNLVAGLSSIVLGIAALRVLRRGPTPDLPMTLSMAFVGLGSIGGYLLSDRVRQYDGFGSVHVLPALLCALLVGSQAVLRVTDRGKRALLVGVFAGVAAASTASDLYSDLRGPLEMAVMNYRFLHAAESFRHTCHDGEGMVFQDEDSSPIVLCRPRHFEIGEHPQTAFTPMYGVLDPNAPATEHPVIYVGTPLF